VDDVAALSRRLLRAVAQRRPVWQSASMKPTPRAVLYGKPYDAPKRRKGPKTAVPTEHQEQAAFVSYLRARGIRHFAVPNGGQRSAIAGARLKAEGVSRGVPDLHVASPPASGVVALIVELKRRNGRPSDVTPEQRDWLAYFDSIGCRTKVAFGLDDARAFVESFYGA